MNKKLVLANGMVFTGNGFGLNKEVITEIVFNTSMVGYQEILSDNSYCDQAIVMTFPLIGNYGINVSDSESITPMCDALIVSEAADFYSHHQAVFSLDCFLKQHHVVGLKDVNTRELTQVIRDHGSQLGMICDCDYPVEQALEQIQQFPVLTNQVSRVSTQKAYRFENTGYRIVALDFGIKLNIIRSLSQLGFDITVLPYNSTVEEIVRYQPDGIFLSNGPGNPESLSEVIDRIKILQNQFPIFGICLGHQLIGLANGCKTKKLHFGHRGGNHPVKNLLTGKVEMTSQNHSYAITDVNRDFIEITHVNVLDQTIEGIRLKHLPVMSVQYHPESAPGPEDSQYLFHQFYDMIHTQKGGQ